MSETNRPLLLLTGASRGIGHATVKRFSDEGMGNHHLFQGGCPR